MYLSFPSVISNFPSHSSMRLYPSSSNHTDKMWGKTSPKSSRRRRASWITCSSGKRFQIRWARPWLSRATMTPWWLLARQLKVLSFAWQGPKVRPMPLQPARRRRKGELSLLMGYDLGLQGCSRILFFEFTSRLRRWWPAQGTEHLALWILHRIEKRPRREEEENILP